MKTRLLGALAALAISFAVPTFAQQKETADPQITAKDLVGTWTLVSLTFEQDGKRPIFMVPIRGAN